MGNTLRRQLMRVSSWGQLFLDLGRKSGRLGLPPNALSLCGLLPITNVGLRIAQQKEASLILIDVLCVTKNQRQLIISLSAALLQGNSGIASSHRSACKLSLRSLQIHPSMTGGRGSPLTVVFQCFKESTLLSFLGLGLYGLNETIVSLTEPLLMWLGLLFCPAKKESYGRWRGLEEFPSLLPLHQWNERRGAGGRFFFLFLSTGAIVLGFLWAGV